MKKYLVTAAFGLTLTLPVTVMAAEAPATYEGKLSYSMGYEMGGYLKSMGADIQQKELIQGVNDAFGEGKALLAPEEMAQVKQEFAQKMQEKQLKQMAEMQRKNLAEGEAYLEKNKAKKGVVVTDSGLQYEVVKEGKGAKATDSDTVTVNYKGTLIDGTVFDSTEKHGKPASFQVDQVIPGWTEALKLMNPGTKLRLVIPAGLAYGAQGAAPVIQPNSVLIFDVELLSVETQEQVEAAAKKAEAALSSDVQSAAKKVKEAAAKVKAAAQGAKAE